MKTSYKSKVKSAGKFCGYLAAIGILTLNQPLNMAFATSIVNGDATTPAYLTQGLTSLDVTVTDNAIFNLATANTNNATVSSINVENNLLAVPVVVSNIKATAANGFTINPFNTSFNTFAANSNNFGIAYTGYGATTNLTQDLNGNGYNVDQEIAAENNTNFNFKGKSTVFSDTITAQDNTQIANIILTIAMKMPDPTMQAFQCSSLSSGETTTLVDEREGGINSYIVGKAADGNCWMLQNLRLGSSVADNGTDSITVAKVDNTTGEVDGTFNLTGKVNAATGKFTNAQSNGVYGTNDNSQFACDEDYGCFYNWYTATASTGTSQTTSGEATASICPAGWTLPTLTQLTSLKNAYSGTAANMLVSTANNAEGAIPGLTLGGSYDNNGRGGAGDRGNYSSSTADSGSYARGLAGLSSGVYTDGIGAKYYGLSVRCISED